MSAPFWKQKHRHFWCNLDAVEDTEPHLGMPLPSSGRDHRGWENSFPHGRECKSKHSDCCEVLWILPEAESTEQAVPFVEKVAFDHNLKNRRSFMKEDRVEGILEGCHSVNSFINFLTYFLAAGAISLGTGFLVFSSALWFLICKRRELFRSPNIKSIDEKLEQRLYKQEAKPQSVFISRNFHTGQPQPQVEHREREAAQMKAVNSKDELCLPDPVDGESPDMLSVEKGSSVTVSVPSSHFSWSMEAANEWFSNDSLEVKTPPEPLLGEPLAEKVLAYLSSVSLEERPRNTTNVTFCGIQKDENTEEMFSQRNTEAGIHNLPCDTE
ncbi:hypothetical protein ACRRTK_016856 [Alexandromys fortis]